MQPGPKSGFVLLLPLLAMGVIVGCEQGPVLAPVEGVVTLDGEPLAGATALFEPDIGAKPAVGVTDISYDCLVGAVGVHRPDIIIPDESDLAGRGGNRAGLLNGEHFFG